MGQSVEEKTGQLSHGSRGCQGLGEEKDIQNQKSAVKDINSYISIHCFSKIFFNPEINTLKLFDLFS